VTRTSFLGRSLGSRCSNGSSNADFGNEEKTGLPLAMGACPDPSRVLVVIKALAFGPPLDIALLSALPVEDFCFVRCDPVPFVFVAAFACREIRPWTAAGRGRVESIVAEGLKPGPTLAENEAMDLPRGGEFLVDVDAVKRGGPAATVVATE
jgi:hypothetical protein